MNVNVKTALAVGQAKGVLYLAASDLEESPCEYSPLAIKQAVTGYGRASKIQVQEMTKVILCLPRIPQPDHAADALAVAICHTHHCTRHARRAGQERGATVIASVRGTLAAVDGERAVVEVGGIGLEVLASGRTLGSLVPHVGDAGQSLHVPQRARGRAAAVRVPRAGGADVLPVAHGGERGRAQGRAGRAVRLPGRGARAGRGARRRQEVREHPRHRQEARPAPGGRAQGQGRRAAAGGRRRSRRDRRRAARRPLHRRRAPRCRTSASRCARPRRPCAARPRTPASRTSSSSRSRARPGE